MSSEKTQDAGSHRNRFFCGAAVGVFQAFAFNPVDRALYLAVIKSRSLFVAANWSTPLTGVGISCVQRTLSVGLFFPLEDLFRPVIETHIASPHVAASLAGIGCGLFSAVTLNPIALVKYNSWRTSNSLDRIIQEGMRTVHTNGWRYLGRAVGSTILRDSTFGATYSFLRHVDFRNGEFLSRSQGPATECAAAVIATILSSPFNYARNMQYGAPGPTPRVVDILWALALETRLRGCGHLIQRLQLVYAPFRTAFAMAFGAGCYNMCVRPDGQSE